MKFVIKHKVQGNSFWNENHNQFGPLEMCTKYETNTALVFPPNSFGATQDWLWVKNYDDDYARIAYETENNNHAKAHEYCAYVAGAESLRKVFMHLDGIEKAVGRMPTTLYPYEIQCRHELYNYIDNHTPQDDPARKAKSLL